jgi:predicted HicB family RNase H-like nuclease
MAANKSLGKMPKPERYTYRTFWSAAEQEFVATVVEFPSISWIANSREEALKGITKVVVSVLKDMVRNGEEIPMPWDERQFSGKFNLRLGAEIHKKVALDAAERNESMNTYIIKKLA